MIRCDISTPSPEAVAFAAAGERLIKKAPYTGLYKVLKLIGGIFYFEPPLIEEEIFCII